MLVSFTTCCSLPVNTFQVVAILESQSEDPLPFSIQAADLDLPELQGEPEDIAKEKCRLAAQQVANPTHSVPAPMELQRLPCNTQWLKIATV